MPSNYKDQYKRRESSDDDSDSGDFLLVDARTIKQDILRLCNRPCFNSIGVTPVGIASQNFVVVWLLLSA